MIYIVDFIDNVDNFDTVDIVDIIDIVDIVDNVNIVGNAAVTDIVGFVDIVDTIDIIDTVEAIWNNARFCNNQSQKCDLITHLISIIGLRDASASKKLSIKEVIETNSEHIPGKKNSPAACHRVLFCRQGVGKREGEQENAKQHVHQYFARFYDFDIESSVERTLNRYFEEHTGHVSSVTGMSMLKMSRPASMVVA